jgi:RNA polymerase sigma-70 factor (ECF subfamily)
MGVIEVPDGQHGGSMPGGACVARASERASTDRAETFHRLADHHLERSYRLATVVLGSGADAQDAVHDAFVVAWRKYDTLRDRTRLEAWFDRIVVNTCRDRMRHGRHLQVLALLEPAELPGADTTEPIADADVIRRALDRLEPDDRIALALRYYRDLQVHDVAELMGISPRAATSRLHRALERLRHILEEDRQEVAR